MSCYVDLFAEEDNNEEESDEDEELDEGGMQVK